MAAMAMLIFTVSCQTEEEVVANTSLSDLKILAEVEVPGTSLTVKVYQYTDDLTVGYNKLEFLVNKGGAEGAFDQATILLKPLMQMSTMSHACPLEQPVLGLNFEESYGGALIFVMPTGDMGFWTLGFEVHDIETGEKGTVAVPINVKLPDQPRLKSFSLDNVSYFVSLVAPSKPMVGINTFEVAIHKKVSMMEWPAVEIAEISIDTEMPDMGHGSPNNINPVHQANGHYSGKVNFTMDGYWKINMDLTLEGLIQKTSFDLTFEHSSTK